MTYAWIDETGLHTSTYAEILADLQAQYRGIFGADLYLESDSQEGQMLALFSLAIHDANQLAVSVYNAFSPQTAQGAGLSRMVKINGLARQVATYSTVDVTLAGTAGTVIAGGVVEDVAGQKWDLPASVTIPASGQVTVTATAHDSGTVQAAAGDVATISTPTRGWLSVTNAAAATPGSDVESDATLRNRQAVSTSLPSQAILEGIVGAVANLTGVTRYKGYENDADVADGNGMPAHSIAIVAEGGDGDAIAQAIAIKKAPGVRTNGTTSVVVADAYGMPSTIRFYRPPAVAVDVALTIAARAGYVSTTGDDIVANLVAYLSGLNIGEDVLLSKLYTPINAAEPDSAKRTFDVTSLAIARHGETPSAANLVLSYIEVASGSSDNFTLTVA